MVRIIKTTERQPNKLLSKTNAGFLLRVLEEGPSFNITMNVSSNTTSSNSSNTVAK